MEENAVLNQLKQKIRERIAMAEDQLAQAGPKAEETFKIMCNEKIFELNWVLQTLETLEHPQES